MIRRLRVDLEQFFEFPALEQVGYDVAAAVPAFDLRRELAGDGMSSGVQLSCSDSPMMMPSGPRTKQSR